MQRPRDCRFVQCRDHEIRKTAYKMKFDIHMESRRCREDKGMRPKTSPVPFTQQQICLKDNGRQATDRVRSSGSLTATAVPCRHAPFHRKNRMLSAFGDSAVSQIEMGMKMRIIYNEGKGWFTATQKSVAYERLRINITTQKKGQHEANVSSATDVEKRDKLYGKSFSVPFTNPYDPQNGISSSDSQHNHFNPVIDKGDVVCVNNYEDNNTLHEDTVLKTISSSTHSSSIHISGSQNRRFAKAPLKPNNKNLIDVKRMNPRDLPAVNDTARTKSISRACNSSCSDSENHGASISNCQQSTEFETISSKSDTGRLLTKPEQKPLEACRRTENDDVQGVFPSNRTAGRLQAFNHRPTTTSMGRSVHYEAQDRVKQRLQGMWRVHSAAATRRLRGNSYNGHGRKISTVRNPQEETRYQIVSMSALKLFRKFRMAGIITLTLIRLKAAIATNSLDRTEHSAAEIQWQTLYGSQEVEKLAFNKSNFSRDRINTKMPRWALTILDGVPEDRSEQDCRRLHALLRGMRSFDKFTEEIQLNLCRAFSYACVGESRIVLKRGHIGHNFYFVYSGSVFVNVQDVDTEGRPFIKTEAILGRGDSFGELALLQDIRRTATVRVRETCELLVVDKDVFGQVCPRIFEKELQEKKNFIGRLPLFSPKWWGPEAVGALCLEAQIQEYKINKIVVENSTTEDWLHICMEGKCEVIRCLSEDGEKDDDIPSRGRAHSLVLSEEIIELLSSASKASQPTNEQEKSESSKEKLLSSLGLEYLQTGKRPGAFIEEVDAEDRKKALQASSGPMTLTALMARRKGGKSRLIYLHVGSLEPQDVFDMSSLIKTCTTQQKNGALLLVSCGARMLRMKKSVFYKLASPEALEHTKTLVSKLTFPSEATTLESYRQKVTWNAYKASIVKEVIRSRDLRSAPVYRGSSRTSAYVNRCLAAKGRYGSSSRPLMASNKLKGKDNVENEVVRSSTDVPERGNKDNADHEGSHTIQRPVSTKSNTTSDQQPEASSFSQLLVVDEETEVDKIWPKTAAVFDSLKHRKLGITATYYPDVGSIEAGPSPATIIVHRRKSSIGINHRPCQSADGVIITRQRNKSCEVVSNQITRVILNENLSGSDHVKYNGL